MESRTNSLFNNGYLVNRPLDIKGGSIKRKKKIPGKGRKKYFGVRKNKQHSGQMVLVLDVNVAGPCH